MTTTDKPQTLEELIEEGKKVRKEMLEALQQPYDQYMAMNNNPTPDEISIDIFKDFIKKVYEAGQEAERENIKEIFDKEWDQQHILKLDLVAPNVVDDYNGKTVKKLAAVILSLLKYLSTNDKTTG